MITRLELVEAGFDEAVLRQKVKALKDHEGMLAYGRGSGGQLVVFGPGHSIVEFGDAPVWLDMVKHHPMGRGSKGLLGEIDLSSFCKEE